MLRNITIRQKMMFFILGVTVVVYIASLSYVLLSLRSKAIDEAEKLADSFAAQKATEIKAVFDEDMAVARNMAAVVKEYTLLPKEERDPLRQDLMVNILEQYPKYDATWMSWQLWAIQEGYTLDYGRERTNFYYRDGTINSSQELANLDGDPTGGVYKYLKDNPHEKEKLAEPYWYLDYNYESGSRDSLLGISPTVVIEVNGRFAGVIGTDMTVDDFASMSEMENYENGYAFLISNEGVIIAHNNKELFSRSMNELSIVKKSPIDVAALIKAGGADSFRVFDEDSGEDVYVSFAPIQIGRTNNPWCAGTIVPISEITAPFNSTLYLTFLAGIIGLLIVTGVIWRVATPITNSLEETNEILKEIANGKLQTNHQLNTEGQDELAQIGRSMEVLVNELNAKAEFSREIGDGNLGVELDVASEDDILGNSLVMMRDNLRSVIKETNDVIKEAGEEGKLQARISSEGKTGAWSDLSVSMNHLLASFSTPLVTLNRIINGMATGDLTLRYKDDAKGDIASMAQNLNQALDNLDGLLHQINTSVNVVDDSSSEMSVASEEMNTNTTEIASAVAQMSNGAQTQVAKVDESSNLIEGILKSSNEMGQTAENINVAAKVVSESSQKGMEMVGDVVSSMGEISDFSSRTNESIQVLTDRSKEIARVLGVITDIASQTNLLALNAAIEAAQAGDAGRGFAVVAEEIRKLAEDSRKSASEIEKLVTDVQSDTLKAARVISEMDSRVKSGEETSKAAATAFEEIFKSSSENLNYSEEILNGAKEQIEDINNVVTIMESVVVIAEQTAAGTEEMASSASELSAGMANYNLKTQKLADIADDLKDGLSMVKLSGTASENTAIFRMKEAFEKEKALLDALLNNMPDTIYFKDRDSKFIRNSKSHADQFGLADPSEMVGKSDFDFFGEHAQKAFDKEKEIMDTRQPMINVIEANDMKDGSVMYTSTTKLPLVDLDGNVVGTFGISRDVTDTKDAEVRAVEQAKAFEKEKSLLDALLTNMPDAIYFKDLQSKFIRCSQSVAEVSGLKRAEDMIGKSDFDFRPKEQAQEWYEDEQDMMRTGRVIKNEVSKNTLPDGSITWVSNTKLPLKSTAGETIGLVGISRDITDTYQQIEELDKLKIENQELKAKLK